MHFSTNEKPVLVRMFWRIIFLYGFAFSVFFLSFGTLPTRLLPSNFALAECILMILILPALRFKFAVLYSALLCISKAMLDASVLTFFLLQMPLCRQNLLFDLALLLSMIACALLFADALARVLCLTRIASRAGLAVKPRAWFYGVLPSAFFVFLLSLGVYYLFFRLDAVLQIG